MNTGALLNKKKRAAFGQAFASGQGLGGADRKFVQFTEKNPSRRLFYSVVIGILIVAALMGIMHALNVPAATTLLVYQITMGGLVVGLLIGTVFLPGTIGDFLSMRASRAGEVAECVSATKKTGEECAKQVAAAHAK